MTGIRLPSQARTAPATPSPPISSAVSPTSTRNTSVRSMKTSNPGAASIRSRTRTPLVSAMVLSAVTAVHTVLLPVEKKPRAMGDHRARAVQTG